MKKAGATNRFTSRACKGCRKRSRGSKPLCHARSTRSWRIISNAKATPKRSNFWNNVARPSRPCSHRQDAEATCLARIQLDDQLLVDHRLHLFARGGVGEAEPEHDVVDPGLEQLEQRLAGHAALAQCVLENAPELTLEQPVLVTELLFFAERDCIIGLLAPRSLWPVHAGRIIFSLERVR